MSIEKARELLQQALVELQDTTTTPPSPTTSTVVKAGQSLQAAIDAAPAGTVLSLEPATFQGPFTFSKSITLQASVVVPTGRRSKTFSPVTLISNEQTVDIKRGTVGPTLVGLTIRTTNGDAQVLSDEGISTRLDRLLILGDPTKGGRRAMAANGKGAVVTQCWMDDCFRFGADSQAIMGWNGTDGLLVQDCYLAGGAETVMFGGATSTAPDMNPKNIAIQRNTLTKNPAWLTNGAQIKCAFEIKNAHDVVVQDNILEYAGTAEGQGGYLIVVTPRNQDNDTPWAEAVNITIDRNVGRHANGVANILGMDSNYPSQRLVGLFITRNLFYDIKGGRTFMVTYGPSKVTIQHNTVVGQQMNGFLTLDGPGKADGLVMVDNILPEGEYGMPGNNVGLGQQAWDTYTQNSTFKNNIIARGTSGRSIAYPGTVFLTAAGQEAVDKTTYKPLAAFVKPGTDGKNIGADVTDVLAATRATL